MAMVICCRSGSNWQNDEGGKNKTQGRAIFRSAEIKTWKWNTFEVSDSSKGSKYNAFHSTPHLPTGPPMSTFTIRTLSGAG